MERQTTLQKLVPRSLSPGLGILIHHALNLIINSHMTEWLPPVSIWVVSERLKNKCDHCHDGFYNTVLKCGLDGNNVFSTIKISDICGKNDFEWMIFPSTSWNVISLKYEIHPQKASLANQNVNTKLAGRASGGTVLLLNFMWPISGQ